MREMSHQYMHLDKQCLGSNKFHAQDYIDSLFVVYH